jgi:Fic family protein
MLPPDLEELTRKIFGPGSDIQARATRIYAHRPGQEPYWHWDDMRHRTPPTDLTAEEWWFATKLARSNSLRVLALSDKAGNPFSYNLPDDVLVETEFVSTYVKGHIALTEQVTNPATRDQYLVSSLIEEAVTSSQLEGASTSMRVAKELIRSGREPRDRSERMVLNNYYAMERVGELRDAPLTIEMICELHRIVTDGTLDDPDAAGRFQGPTDIRVGVYDDQQNLLYEPPPAGEIETRVRELCDFANEASSRNYLPGVLRALAIHFMVGYIHPFEDGNGRTARVLFYWSMLKQGYWLTEFLSVSSLLKKAPARYGRSYLLTETDNGDLTYFFIYHLGIIHRGIDGLIAYLGRKVQEAREVRRMLAGQEARFNSRQIGLLRNAMKDPTASYSVQSHTRSHRIGMESARKDLANLEEAGLLSRHRVGKKHVFTPVDGLVDAIQNLAPPDGARAHRAENG